MIQCYIYDKCHLIVLSLLCVTQGCAICNRSSKISIYLYIPLAILLTLLSALAMFYFNVGMSPVLDSWLFFVQVNFVNLNRNNLIITWSFEMKVSYLVLQNEVIYFKDFQRINVSTGLHQA